MFSKLCVSPVSKLMLKINYLLVVVLSNKSYLSKNKIGKANLVIVYASLLRFCTKTINISVLSV